MALNETAQIIQSVMNNATIMEYKAIASPFLPSVIVYWLFQFVLTMAIGLIVVKRDLGNFFGIFILTQLIGAVILFFIFMYPVVPIVIQGLGWS